MWLLSVSTAEYFPVCTTTVGQCSYDFYVERDPFLHPVLIDQSCAPLLLWTPYEITIALVLAIILIGLLILCIFKIAFVLSVS